MRGIATGDFDGDGRTDVATLEPSSGKGVLITAIRPDTVGVCGCVPETLALFTHANASLGTFIPGITKDDTATTTASVIATGQRAALSVSEPGYLSSGAATLRSPLAVEFSKSAWTEPVAYDPVTITLKQHIDANETLRAGTYSRTLTFTLSATMP